MDECLRARVVLQKWTRPTSEHRIESLSVDYVAR